MLNSSIKETLEIDTSDVEFPILIKNPLQKHEKNWVNSFDFDIKTYKINIIGWKEDTFLTKISDILVFKCCCLLFTISLIEYSLEDIVTNGHFNF